MWFSLLDSPLPSAVERSFDALRLAMGPHEIVRSNFTHHGDDISSVIFVSYDSPSGRGIGMQIGPGPFIHHYAGFRLS
jgi:hypothetical protein